MLGDAAGSVDDLLVVRVAIAADKWWLTAAQLVYNTAVGEKK